MRRGSSDKYVRSYKSYDQVDGLAVQCLLGLKALYEKGVIHRDLKTVNFLLDSFDNVKLTDFEIAGFQNARMTRRNFLRHAEAVFGTYACMAPEQLNQKISFKTISPDKDIFSIGVTFNEIITGRLSFGPLDSEDDLGSYAMRAHKGLWKNPRIHISEEPVHWIEIFENSLNSTYTKREQSTS